MEENYKYIIILLILYSSYNYTRYFIMTINILILSLVTFAIICSIRFKRINDLQRNLIYVLLIEFFQSATNYRPDVIKLKEILKVLF